jgi:hypothetical protein
MEVVDERSVGLAEGVDGKRTLYPETAGPGGGQNENPEDAHEDDHAEELAQAGIFRKL